MLTIEDLADIRERMIAYQDLAELSRLHNLDALARHADRLVAQYAAQLHTEAAR